MLRKYLIVFFSEQKQHSVFSMLTWCTVKSWQLLLFTSDLSHEDICLNTFYFRKLAFLRIPANCILLQTQEFLMILFTQSIISLGYQVCTSKFTENPIFLFMIMIYDFTQYYLLSWQPLCAVLQMADYNFQKPLVVTYCNKWISLLDLGDFYLLWIMIEDPSLQFLGECWKITL